MFNPTRLELADHDYNPPPNQEPDPAWLEREEDLYWIEQEREREND